MHCSVSLKKYIKELYGLEYQEESIKEFIIKTIMSKNDISNMCLEYLNKFKLINENLIFQPTMAENLKYSGIRNFLMELEIVSLKTKGIYLFSGGWTLAESAFNSALSPKLFEQIQKMKMELGEKAELVALEEEKKRLSKYPELAQKLRHISQKNG